MNGGSTTKSALQSQTVMSSQSSPRCRAIPSPHGSGKNTPTRSCKSLA
jgi:hypothetical protein